MEENKGLDGQSSNEENDKNKEMENWKKKMMG